MRGFRSIPEFSKRILGCELFVKKSELRTSFFFFVKIVVGIFWSRVANLGCYSAVSHRLENTLLSLSKLHHPQTITDSICIFLTILLITWFSQGECNLNYLLPHLLRVPNPICIVVACNRPVIAKQSL
ncbi:hypothetical protein VTN77DRAFT_3897 [Rasamsonia byssochlamydoides]|uniref:uncharacterized protein n=1 Tax=Rasamsonia byssochlamydoides TaxID=89139 RepID=UPI0037449F7B